MENEIKMLNHKEEVIVNFEELTSQVEDKRLELCEQLKKKIQSYIVKVDENDYAVAFVREPERPIKLMAMDALSTNGGVSKAGTLIFDSCVVREASDPRVLTNDDLYITMVMNCLDTIKIYTEVTKKK